MTNTIKHKRVGIFRGTFNPIHPGHVAFALQAINEAKLDRVYFLPEISPPHKPITKKISTRMIEISEAINNYPNLELLAIDNMNGSIGQIIPNLKKKFSGDRLVFLIGSDIAKTLSQWADLTSLVFGNELLIGLRGDDNENEIKTIIDKLSSKPIKALIIHVPKPHISSSAIRGGFDF